MDKLEILQQRLAAFAKVRAWESFHSPKNLSMALIGECGELIEHFQWLTEEESQNLDAATLNEVRFEMADIQIYLLRLADVLKVDLVAAANEKTTLNETRFPIDAVYGRQKHGEDYS